MAPALMTNSQQAAAIQDSCKRAGVTVPARVSSPVTNVASQEPAKGSGEQEEEHKQGCNAV